MKKIFKIKRRGRKSKFKSLIIEKDFEPENPKQLEELDENSCKWPIGHPDEKSFYFCGRSSLKDFSYCKLHLLYAYQPKGKKEEVLQKKMKYQNLLKKKYNQLKFNYLFSKSFFSIIFFCRKLTTISPHITIFFNFFIKIS